MKNKIIVITGGCGQVGLATIKRLSSNENILISLVRKDVSSCQDIIKQFSKNNIMMIADVTDSNRLKIVAEEIKEKYGKIDVLINAAAVSKNILSNDIKNLDDETFDNILKTNVRGTFASIREFYDLLNLSDNGLIINLSSTAGLRASQSNLAYAASKSGIDIMTKSLAKNLAPKIRVVCIAPGYLEKSVSGVVKHPDANKKFIDATPMKKIGTGDDVAVVIENLIYNLKQITGQTIVVDGGLIL
jgi:NAD(P)-dependent dehydrogenase (short-subunit alcohol dehydrogenase family)